MENFEGYAKLIDTATNKTRGDLPGGEKYDDATSVNTKDIDIRQFVLKNPKFRVQSIPDLEALKIASIQREEDCRQLFIDVKNLTPLEAADRVLKLQANNPDVEVVPFDSSIVLEPMAENMGVVS